MTNLGPSDIDQPPGPYWAAYQRFRRRNGVFENPDSVPTWWLRKLIGSRVQDARVALEQLNPGGMATPVHDQMRRTWNALRLVADFLETGDNQVGQRDAVLTALLGGQEERTEQERADYRWGDLATVSSPLPLRMPDAIAERLLGLARTERAIAARTDGLGPEGQHAAALADQLEALAAGELTACPHGCTGGHLSAHEYADAHHNPEGT